MMSTHTHTHGCPLSTTKRPTNIQEMKKKNYLEARREREKERVTVELSVRERRERKSDRKANIQEMKENYL